ncbi:hypothetical protein [Neobacillus sp. LXY-4]|uniref:hypothetical protein n=1 Tax=Neobacillus sp. LXY-4 TaxID=3379826 RepID=UPI003EE31038
MGLFQFTPEHSFERVFNQLKRAPAPKNIHFQQTVFEEASALLKETNGLVKLFHYAHLFDEAGVFAGKPWENVGKLNPVLVRGTLHAGGTMAAAEALSNLRILAIATGVYVHPEMSAYEANGFLTKVLALNIDLLLMKETEENRVKQLYKDQQAAEILRFISDHCFSALVFQTLYEEVDNLAVQRPIVTDKILKLICSAKKLAGGLEEKDSSLMRYENSVYSPSNLAAGNMDMEGYENKLRTCNNSQLIHEAEQLRVSMDKTGLVSPYHELFLHFINKEKPDFLLSLLAADRTSRKNLRSNLHFISTLIHSAITTKSRRSIYGLMRLIQRDLLSSEFKHEFKKLMKISIHGGVKKRISELYNITHHREQVSLLLSGMISVLGQPLGIGQGFNPTCQSTRALSYWAQREPLLLLKLFNHFLEQGKITLEFEGRSISSDTLPHVSLDDEVNIDIVSQLLIPHLDSIYIDMLKSAEGRGQDPHKWINPSFHIKGIWPEFSDVYSDLSFSDRFKQHYHPSNNPNVNEELPQPAGITIYNQAGQVLGAHAVLIQRVDMDPEGITRVYFYNPNNDSLQVWGNSIKTSIANHGELEGESSLPFDDFLPFLYAFHYKA